MPHVPDAVLASMVALRRGVHAKPELGHREHHTMHAIADALTTLGLSPRTGIAGTGVVADLQGVDPTLPRVALRADTDALPIQEETGLPFASTHDGVMHACGHDAHLSMLVGAAALLRQRPPPGPVRLVFQPAEELGTGAAAMIEAGVLDGVSAIFGGHVDVRYPPGTLVVSDGPVNGSTDTFDIVVHGSEGHGARPHTAVDAIAVACTIVSALQHVVAREFPPGEPAVITVGAIHGGKAPNVIAGRVSLSGTLRAQNTTRRDQLREALDRIATAVATAHRARAEVTVHEGTPALINRPGPSALARQAATALVGAEHVTCLTEPNLGGEDFARFLQHVPGAYIRFGARPDLEPCAPAHNGRFRLHEGVLPVGAAWLDRIARDASHHLGSGGSL